MMMTARTQSDPKNLLEELPNQHKSLPRTNELAHELKSY